MKIYTYIKIDMATGETLKEEFFEYSGPMAMCYEGFDIDNEAAGNAMDTTDPGGIAGEPDQEAETGIGLGGSSGGYDYGQTYDETIASNAISQMTQDYMDSGLSFKDAVSAVVSGFFGGTGIGGIVGGVVGLISAAAKKDKLATNDFKEGLAVLGFTPEEIDTLAEGLLTREPDIKDAVATDNSDQLYTILTDVVTPGGGGGGGTSTVTGPKADPWNDFLNKYYGVKPTDDDPGTPSLYDRILNDATGKAGEANDFLTRMEDISKKTVGGLQPYADMLKHRLSTETPFKFGFGPNAPVKSYTLPSTLKMGQSYTDVTKDIAAAKKSPAEQRLGLADILSPEKGHLDYMALYEPFIKWYKKFVLDEERTKKGLDLAQQQLDKTADESPSWMSTIAELLNIGQGIGDIFSVTKKT